MPDRENVISLVEDAIEIVEKEAFWTIASGLRDAIAMMKEQEVKTGKWIPPEEEGCLVYDPNVYVQCSVCRKKAQYGKKDKYCRNCGAMMEV